LYDLAGNVVTELSATGGWNRVEIYASGKHVATYSGGATGTTYFDHVDWLGTERARTDAQGDMAETCTGLPYGDDLNCTAGGLSPLYFTGKERDTETGNDYFGARYYGSGAGRFMSSDPANAGATPSDPQSWNAYSYGLNNPLSLTDPTALSPNLPPPVEGWGDWFQQLSGMCAMDFGEMPCGLGGEFAGGVGEAQCPNEACSGVENGQFVEFEATAGSADGYLNSGEIDTGLYDWGGRFYSPSQWEAFMQAGRDRQRWELAVIIANHSGGKLNAKRAYDLLEWKKTQGGNADFKWQGDLKYLACIPGSAKGGCEVTCRAGSIPSPHMHGFIHLDTGNLIWGFGLGAIIHGIFDVALNNLNPSIAF
jgi:RHS repeat-associated protein